MQELVFFNRVCILSIRTARINLKTCKESHFAPTLEHVHDIVRLVMFMIVVGHTILGFPQRASYWLFSMCKYIIQTTAQKLLRTLHFEGWFNTILSNFPLHIRSAAEKFNLEGKSEIYAVCPACHANYKPVYIDQIPTYRARCNSRRYGHRCREILTRTKLLRGTTIQVPIKPYIVFDFQDWMANLLSRTGYEQEMDAAWTRMRQAPGEGGMNDIFQGSRIRKFKGPDGNHFSESGPPASGRYLFSLGFDFYNPLRNLTNGKRVSVGVIALVCLNLPINLRYKPENLFLAGIIPGPKEPDYDHINPYFKPIVDVFLVFWDGIFFTRTSRYEMGRMIFCALLLLICDLPAARKAGGFVGVQHEHYCSICYCNRTINPYDDYKHDMWVNRTDEECRRAAKNYFEAVSKKKADGCADSTGVRCAEFLRLPYYDVTKSLVVDPMHNLFLGLIKEHFQNILGHGKSKKDLQGTADSFSVLDINISSTDPENPPPEKKEQLSGVKRLIACLQKPLTPGSSMEQALKDLIDEMMKSNRVQVPAFVYVGKGLGCLPRSLSTTGKDGSRKYKKTEMAFSVATWVST